MTLPSPGIQPGAPLLPPATATLQPFGRLVCTSLAPLILLQPTHYAAFHPGVSVSDASTSLAGELVVTDVFDVLVVLIRSVDLVVTSVFLENPKPYEHLKNKKTKKSVDEVSWYNFEIDEVTYCRRVFAHKKTL
jgi:hypothetical protein